MLFNPTFVVWGYSSATPELFPAWVKKPLQAHQSKGKKFMIQAEYLYILSL